MTDTKPSIVLTDVAAALVKADVAADKREVKRYADYVKEMSVTHETVAAHVAMFRDAYKLANKKASGDEIKAYATKVRNGLNRNVTRPETTPADVDYLKRLVAAFEAATEHGITVEDIQAALSI